VAHKAVNVLASFTTEGQMIEIDALLKPIRDDSPSGVDFRLDPEKDAIFGRVKEFRQVLDPAHDPDGRGKEPNWSAVIKACEEALGKETKDLELIAYLTEGLTHRHGFVGFHQGLELMRRSLETFWDSIHPGIDEDGISEALRSRWVSWFSSAEFLRAVKSAPINRADAAEGRGTADRAPDLSWADYEGALMVDDQTISDERRKELLEAGYMTLEEFQSRVGATAPDQLRAVVDRIGDCVSEIQALERFSEERFKEADEQPNLFPLRTLLNEKVRDFLAERCGVLEGASEGTEAAQGAGTGSNNATGADAAGPVATRQDALQRLREVGDFFRRTEPHSPLAHLIGRAVRWGDMSFEELLRDLARNDKLIEQIWETLGLDKPGGSGK
jgi:type VI secretion system protein ImpA